MSCSRAASSPPLHARRSWVMGGSGAELMGGDEYTRAFFAPRCGFSPRGSASQAEEYGDEKLRMGTGVGSGGVAGDRDDGARGGRAADGSEAGFCEGGKLRNDAAASKGVGAIDGIPDLRVDRR